MHVTNEQSAFHPQISAQRAEDAEQAPSTELLAGNGGRHDEHDTEQIEQKLQIVLPEPVPRLSDHRPSHSERQPQPMVDVPESNALPEIQRGHVPSFRARIGTALRATAIRCQAGAAVAAARTNRVTSADEGLVDRPTEPQQQVDPYDHDRREDQGRDKHRVERPIGPRRGLHDPMNALPSGLDYDDPSNHERAEGVPACVKDVNGIPDHGLSILGGEPKIPGHEKSIQPPHGSTFGLVDPHSGQGSAASIPCRV